MKNQRKTKVVNPGYQYRNSVISIAVAIILINFFIIMGSVFPDFSGVTISFTAVQYFIVGLAELALICFFWIYTIRQSHKVAGPVYAFARIIKQFGEGDLTVKVALRSGDYFQESAEIINTSLGSVCSTVAKAKRIAESIQVSAPEIETESKLKELREVLSCLNTTPIDPSAKNHETV